jgi:hypothetical protein
MQNPVKISIANPCSHDWNAMQHDKHGGYCSKCSSLVVDFTRMTDAQVLEALAGMNGKRCGRFTAEQVNRPIVKSEPAKSQFRYKALFAGLAAFLGMKSVRAENGLVITPSLTRFEQFDTIAKRIDDTATVIRADTSAKMVVIRGQVIGTFAEIKRHKRRPIKNAQISASDGLNTTITDKDGYFKLKVLYRANTEINISSGSYEFGNKTILLSEFLLRKRPLVIKLVHEYILGRM